MKKDIDWSEPVTVIGIGLLFITIIVGIVLFVGWVTSGLWNFVMPHVFGLPTISFWQAWALVLLSSILLKSNNISTK